jgi:hypothetical protein
MKLILLLILANLTFCSVAQNTITVRKSDTTFNSFFYAAKVQSASYDIQSSSSNGAKFWTKKKSRIYYIFGDSGDIWYFTESKNYKKVKKLSDAKNWTLQQPNGKYYIKGTDLVIFPYVRQIDGTYTLGKVSLDGSYFGSFLEMEMGLNTKRMLLLE